LAEEHAVALLGDEVEGAETRLAMRSGAGVAGRDPFEQRAGVPGRAHPELEDSRLIRARAQHVEAGIQVPRRPGGAERGQLGLVRRRAREGLEAEACRST